MKRRDFSSQLGGAAAILWSPEVFAQKTVEMPRIAVVGIESDQKAIEVFDQGMRAAD